MAADKTFATACGTNAGPLLSDVSTVYAARDMDLLRAALGDAKLTYVGYSYGTFLGATYAGLFPDHVRALVLDAAVDPALDLVGRLRGQATSFEGALDRFLASCSADPHCDFYEGGASARAFDRLIAGLDRKPLAAPLVGGGRAATAGEAWSAILGALYSPGFGWPYLAQALGLAAQGDGSLLLETADALNGRKPDGEYSNEVEANGAINCVDEPAPTDPAAYVTLAQQLVRTAPRVGRVLAASGLTCAYWPVQPSDHARPDQGGRRAADRRHRRDRRPGHALRVVRGAGEGAELRRPADAHRRGPRLVRLRDAVHRCAGERLPARPDAARQGHRLQVSPPGLRGAGRPAARRAGGRWRRASWPRRWSAARRSR